MTSVDFYFDPVCPWTWITARWVTDVASQRPLDITWRLFSLRHHNRDNPGYDWIRDEMDAQYPALRIMEAARTRHGNDAVARLYTAFGTRIHHDGDSDLTTLADVVRAEGFDDDLLAAGADASLDAAIEASTGAGLALVGRDAGIPIVAVDGAATTFFGPVLSPAPTGADAADLWDHFQALLRFEGLFEIKRTREVGPLFGPRPAGVAPRPS